MTTLAANSPRPIEGGHVNEFGVIAADIVYEGAAVGLVDGTGYAQPLASSGNRFVGFAIQKADNAAGAAGDKTVRVYEEGKIQLSVSGAVISDVGQPVYATDDDTFVFSPVGGIFIGYVHRWVSSGVVVVRFNAPAFRDPHGDHESRMTKSADYTLAATDTGKLIWVDTDAITLTLPAIATGLDGVKIVNGGAFGTIAVKISPNASDMILGPGITGADDKDLINTKATARRGDYVVIGGNDADGYGVQEISGTWAREA